MRKKSSPPSSRDTCGSAGFRELSWSMREKPVGGDMFLVGPYTISYSYSRGVWTVRRDAREVGTAVSADAARQIVYSSRNSEKLR